MVTDLVQVRAALEAAAGRTADLLGSIPDGELPVKGLTWTAGEVEAHLVFGLRGYTHAVAGSFEAVSPYIPDTDIFRDRCHLWAHPVALILVVYGRISQWRPIARGQLLAWGRRPWLGLTFKNLFFNP